MLPNDLQCPGQPGPQRRILPKLLVEILGLQAHVPSAHPAVRWRHLVAA